MDEILDRIDEVWGSYGDFNKEGFQYAVFVIKKDLEEMEEENWDEEETVQEFADVIINSLRVLLSKGYDPEEEILNRLDDHEQKDLEKKMEQFIDEFD